MIATLGLCLQINLCAETASSSSSDLKGAHRIYSVKKLQFRWKDDVKRCRQMESPSTVQGNDRGRLKVLTSADGQIVGKKSKSEPLQSHVPTHPQRCTMHDSERSYCLGGDIYLPSLFSNRLETGDKPTQITPPALP